MSNEHPNEKPIFNVASAIEAPELRLVYLDQVCNDDRALRERVLHLLRMHDEEPAFLDAYPEGAVAILGTPRVIENLDTQIGPYKLREQLGEGGMGVVYVAEQSEPVRRKVALKIIKPGMDSQQVIARFESERQALAMMDHPHIARIIDAGTTESGLSYFVMELVYGAPINEFCDQHQLTTEERLRVFVKVCRAVQHAHQKGIIHRDLKPSNILVASVDGDAVPKVIDFGVAKAADPQIVDATVYTQFSQIVGTPLYMSPEQAELGVADVDTRSDVYSLGVMLYELLTGSTPFDSKTLKQAGFDEMRRIIREDEPPPPSARVSTLRANALSTISRERRCDPRQLNRALRGELDWIVMKCLEKDRNRRYESASELAMDVQRHLQDEPITARPVSWVYRTKKFARRHRVLFASSAAVLFALLCGLALATLGFLQAERRLRLAISEQRDKDEMIEMLRDICYVPWGKQGHSQQLTMQKAFNQLADDLDERLQDNPKVESEIRHIIGQRYIRLGNYNKAREHLAKALRLRQQLYRPDHEKVAEVHLAWASAVEWVLHDGPHDLGEMIEHARKAIEIYERHGKVPQGAYFYLGFALEFSPTSQDEAEIWIRKALAVDPDSPFALADLAVHLFAKSEHGSEEAIQHARRAVELSEKLHGPEDFKTAFPLSVLANAYRTCGQLEEAISAASRAWYIYDTDELRMEPKGHEYAFELAELYYISGQPDQGNKLLTHIEEVAREVQLWESVAQCHYLKGWADLLVEDYQSAEHRLRSAIQVAQRLPPTHEDRALPEFYLTRTLYELGQVDEAQRRCQELVKVSGQYAASEYASVMTLYGHAWLLLHTGREDKKTIAEALDVARRGLELAKAWPHTRYEFHMYLVTAMALWKTGGAEQREEAIRLLEQGLEAAKDTFPIWHARGNRIPVSHRELETTLASYYSANDRFEDARNVHIDAIHRRQGQLVDNHLQIALAHLRFGEFLLKHHESECSQMEARRELSTARDLLRRCIPPAPDAIVQRAASKIAELDQTNPPVISNTTRASTTVASEKAGT